MTRAQLEHVIRAAATLTAQDHIVVIGSQAVLGQFPDAPAELRASDEADVYPRDAPAMADLIDGSIGELSPFHETFGYYAQGVGPETAVLPAGWQARLVAVSNANTRGATGWCLEVHDLLLAKYVAGRPKDRRFIEHALRAGLADADVLRARARALPVDDATRARIELQIAGDARRWVP